MPRKGTTESAALSRAEKKENAHQLKYGMLQTSVVPKYKLCDFCGRSIMINNYADGKSRTPRWRKTQMVICPWCNPLSYQDKVIKPSLYKTIQSRVIVERLAEMNFCFTTKGEPLDDLICKCVGCVAHRLVGIQDEHERLKV